MSLASCRDCKQIAPSEDDDDVEVYIPIEEMFLEAETDLKQQC